MTALTKRIIAVDGDPNAIDESGSRLPLSDGVLVGDTLHVAGRIGIDPETGRAAADPAREIQLMLDSLRSVLTAAEMTMDDLTSVQVYCTDLSLFDLFNEIYRTYFRAGFPARAFLGAPALLLNARFEICAVAHRARLCD